MLSCTHTHKYTHVITWLKESRWRCVCVPAVWISGYGVSGEYTALSVRDGSTWSSTKGSTHLTLQHYNLAIPVQPPGRVCVYVCVWGMGVKKRENIWNKSIALCSPVQSPMGGNPAVYLDRFLPWITRTFTPAAYPHHNLISHTIGMPLAEDTHTHTHIQCNKTQQG